MKIASLATERFRLPLVTPLASAHGVLRSRDGVLVALRAADGTIGFGEAMPLPGFGLESLTQVERALEAIGRTLAGRDAGDVDAALDAVREAAPGAPSARAAADFALHDLAARLRGVPVAALLAGAPPAAFVPANGFVSAATPREAAAEARRLVAAGYDTLKVKLGRDAALDVARVAAVRAAAGAHVALRLDANGAWTVSEAAHRLDALLRFAPSYVEEPIAAASLADWSRLAVASGIALAADESLRGDARGLLASGAVRWIVVKPAALGGLAPARRLARSARAARIRVVVTGFLDSALGRAAALHLAASLPEPIEAAGIATGSLLAADLAVLPSAPRIAVPASGGFGLRPARARELVRAPAARA